MHQIAAVEKRHDRNAVGKNAVVQLFDLSVDSFQHGVRIGPFTQQHDARHYVVVVDDFSVDEVSRPRELAQTDLRTLLHDRDIFDLQRRPGLGREHGVFDVVDVRDEADFADVDLLQAGFDETAAGVGVVIGELLLDLPDAESVGDQFARGRCAPDTRASGRRNWPHPRRSAPT